MIPSLSFSWSVEFFLRVQLLQLVRASDLENCIFSLHSQLTTFTLLSTYKMLYIPSLLHICFSFSLNYLRVSLSSYTMHNSISTYPILILKVLIKAITFFILYLKNVVVSCTYSLYLILDFYLEIESLEPLLLFGIWSIQNSQLKHTKSVNQTGLHTCGAQICENLSNYTMKFWISLFL